MKMMQKKLIYQKKIIPFILTKRLIKIYPNYINEK